MVKLTKVLLLAIGLAACADAHAWFVFFVPGSVTRAIGDAFTGSKGNICVKEGTKAGDVLNANNGNTAKVISVSGTSSICQNPVLPIRAELEFTYSFSSKAGIDLPDDYESRSLTELERFNGFVLKAESKTTKNQGVQVSSTAKKPNRDLQTMANNIETSNLRNPNFKQAHSQNPEQIIVNGMNAIRWEIVGTLKGLFGQDVTYLYTLLEGDDEVVLVNVYSPRDRFAEQKAEFAKISETVVGLRAERLEPVTTSDSKQHSSASMPTSEGEQAQVSPSRGTVDQGTESLEGRLLKVKKLFNDGLITKEEYDAKRSELLNGL
jgi:hypothetical protein